MLILQRYIGLFYVSLHTLSFYIDFDEDDTFNIFNWLFTNAVGIERLMISWHICSKQELRSQQRQTLLGNGPASTIVDRQQHR
jgi:hypothetical protein